MSTPTVSINISGLTDYEALVAAYVKTRDRISEANDKHKERMKPANELLESLESKIMQMLSAQKINSVKTEAGTAYVSEKASATLNDPQVFKQFVLTKKLYDLADWRANAPAVREYIDNNKQTPPGVNFSTKIVLGVRRA